MKVEIEGQDPVLVHWKYKVVPVFGKRMVNKTTENPHGEQQDVRLGNTTLTQCIAECKGEIIAIGEVRRYYKDVENREEARNRSLQAMLNVHLPVPFPKMKLSELKPDEAKEKQFVRSLRTIFCTAYRRRNIVPVPTIGTSNTSVA